MKNVVFAVFGIGIVQLGLGGEVKLTWDPNPPEDQVEAYIVYEHHVKSYAPLAFVRTNLVVLTNVFAGDHCYVVTASNRWGESSFSNEACTHIKVPDDLNDPGGASNFVFTASVGSSLVITNLELNSEVPWGNRFYSLCDSDPAADIRVNPINGVVHYRPTQEVAGSTNSFTVCLTDTRSSLQAATRQIQVSVPDYAGAWLGSNEVLDFHQTQVPLSYYASKPLMDLYLVLEIPAQCVTDLELIPDPAQACLLYAEPISAHQWMIVAMNCEANPIRQEIVLGQLQFRTTAGGSCFLPIRITDVTAFQFDGSAFPVVAGHNTRIVIVGINPILEMMLGEDGQKNLHVYGQPGSRIQIEFNSTSPTALSWLPAWQVDLTEFHQVIDGSKWNISQSFFRARVLDPAP